jgi:hypothetical protein
MPNYDDQKISDFLSESRKIGAIKHLRALVNETFGNDHNLGLLEAKTYLDGHNNRPAAFLYGMSDGFATAALAFIFMDDKWKNFHGLPVKSDENSLNEFREFVRNKLDGNVTESEDSVIMANIYGYRAFRYEDQRLHPLSMRSHDFVTFGRNVDQSPAPDIHNHFGFWLFKKKAPAIAYGGRYGIGFYNCAIIWATVQIFGEVVEHEHGFRASEFEIIGLYSDVANGKRRGIANKLAWPGKIGTLSQMPEKLDNTDWIEIQQSKEG